MISPQMQNCEKPCYSDSSQAVKVNFIDRLVGRNYDEKVMNFCHIKCLKQNKIRNEKRNGRWGFIPVLGITEVFSSLFALISFFLLVWNFKSKVSQKLHRSPMKKQYLMHYYIGCAAFISSFMFHFRETRFTRNADYFSAFASILMGLLISINRLVLFASPKKFKKFSDTTVKLGIFYFIFHVYKMHFFEFDYLYNKIACGLMFFISSICNFITFLQYRKEPHAKNIVYAVCCLLLAGGVEILDISPILYLFDSHALWHLLMAISTPLYFSFVSGDIDLQNEADFKKLK